MPRPRAFALGITFEPTRTIVDVVGELDMLTAPALAAHLALVAEDPETPITVDLEHLDFLGAAGLGVIAGASARAAVAGTPFDVRSISDGARRTFVAGGLQRLTDSSFEVVRRGPVPASNETIDATLRLVTSLAEATIHGADGVSVSLERHGTLATVAYSNDLAARMDQHQYDTGQGPCVSAATEGAPVYIDALQAETRWPAFVPRAIEEGIGSVLSTPLVVADRPIGALNILSRDEGALGETERELGAFFASHASAILAAGGADVSDRERDRAFAAALQARALLSQAQGVLMARRGIDAHASADLLYRWARVAEITVLQQAMEVVASTIGVGPDA